VQWPLLVNMCVFGFALFDAYSDAVQILVNDGAWPGAWGWRCGWCRSAAVVQRQQFVAAQRTRWLPAWRAATFPRACCVPCCRQRAGVNIAVTLAWRLSSFTLALLLAFRINRTYDRCAAAAGLSTTQPAQPLLPAPGCSTGQAASPRAAAAATHRCCALPARRTCCRCCYRCCCWQVVDGAAGVRGRGQRRHGSVYHGDALDRRPCAQGA
jgi:hypothetical protein